ncbi:HAL/PAL/TAL family ammonia-lyase [Pseudonocardia sp. HH130630-07]|uniref:HAL/PAL/TAL family ammonia-lyase n=1 Tax=Pseudonocardia sp. HH130630-07 TaxID=1690815 RepID=UPI000815164F|nr:aromatic amino acid ammonia-lyase [Pseudonocardia sp. HH130630-07]ANY10835.1 hypothetical protein AFB00_31070 [Pseudonocardia sp. HH130630-07]
MTQFRGHQSCSAVIDPRRIGVDGVSLTLRDVVDVARRGAVAELSSPGVADRAAASRQVLTDLVEQGRPVYGVTTGFGDSVRRQIAGRCTAELQRNLIGFLGCGTGKTLPIDVARAVVMVRANSLARGHSGVRPALLEALLDLLNSGVTPIIPEEGSVGASGDLVPLSYVAAVLTGQREADLDGRRIPAAMALEAAGLEPFELAAKEGLSLVNGTAFMTALGTLVAADARRLLLLAEVNTALTTEVLRGITGPFAPFLHDVAKPHPGQVASARAIRGLLAGSGLAVTYEDVVDRAGTSDTGYRVLAEQIQEQYSLRCAPQFLGVLRDALEWVERWLVIEVNSANDNPLVDSATGAVVSGGNFAGGHVGLAMDTLKTAVASVLDLLDRQLELVVDEKFNNGLTPNLVRPVLHDDPQAGLHHGFKGVQLACSSLTADALSRCVPVTVFSRSTECHNQDKVSMGATAARQARDVVEIGERAVVLHLLALCQAADLRGPQLLGRTRAVYDRVRAVSRTVDADRALDKDVAAVLGLLRDDSLLEGVG